MGKKIEKQRFVYKIQSSRLRKSKWNLRLPLCEARRNDEIIALADSQILRWIDQINGVTDTGFQISRLKSEIKHLRRSEPSIQTGRQVRKLYDELDKLQFVQDYMLLVIDRKSDYYRACKGFEVNGIKYKRLLGTSGGIKNSTIVFVSENVIDTLRQKIDNDRDPDKELVTAKLEAYMALTCSSSTPVSRPAGVLVVNDVETTFTTDYIYLSDELDGEPTMETRTAESVTIDASDGYGLIHPALAERWSEEMQLGYVSGGFNTRFAFEKGMVVAFDYLEFADRIAGNYFVKDAWGDDVDIRDVELVLTTSMVKLWDSYSSCKDYLEKSYANGYAFCVTKTAPESLESERNLNYQFIQSYDLDDRDIDDLIRPTIDEINDVIGGDWRKTIIFLCGSGLNDSNVEHTDFIYAKAIMADPHVLDDPYVRHVVYQLIKDRIRRAKCGVVKVHGNYSIISGDPYLLCQSIFGLEKTGLLKAGEIYNKFWADDGAEKLVCFRAPMTCHNNIRAVRPVRNDETSHWYRYIQSMTVFNGWDTAMAALNGADADGDIVMLTDNDVLIRKHIPMPALMCVQRRAKKRVSTESDFVESNISSFGNEIGQTTNWITSMFEVRAGFPTDSKEYRVLTYRIMCGQLFQQNTIDKAKGIVSKPMPAYWHDTHSILESFTGDDAAFQQNVAATRKPYFMRYIYPALSKQYNTFIAKTNETALRRFGVRVDDLLSIDDHDLSDEQSAFLRRYHSRLPVGTNDCVMNKICKRFEEEFDGCIVRYSSTASFDYTYLKTDATYQERKYYEVKRLYDSYNKRMRGYEAHRTAERVDPDDAKAYLFLINNDFAQDCARLCPDSNVLCNIVLDMCYKRSSTKCFSWNLCGDEIVDNLVRRNGGVIRYPTQDRDGDIIYGGKRFRLETKKVGVIGS